MAWKNLGDINPKQGTFLIQDAEVDDRCFRADAVEVIPDTEVGGSDGIFLIVQGRLFLDRKNFATALDTCGARIEGETIVRPSHTGGEDRFDLASDEGRQQLAYAAHAYGGIEKDIEVMVMHGLPDIHQNPPKLGVPDVVFPDSASFWAVMRAVLDGFDYLPPGLEEEVDAIPLDVEAWDEHSPYAGLPSHVTSAEDLRVMPAIRAVEEGITSAEELPEDLRKLWSSLLVPDLEPGLA